MPEVNVLGARLKPWEEGGKAAGWNQKIRNGDRQEHDAEQSRDQW